MARAKVVESSCSFGLAQEIQAELEEILTFKRDKLLNFFKKCQNIKKAESKKLDDRVASDVA